MLKTFLPLLTIIFLASCSTTKTIFRERTVTDSTALHEINLAQKKKFDSLLNVKVLDSIAYNNLIEAMSESGIILDTNSNVKIHVWPSGEIDVSGKGIKSINTKSSSKQTETLYWKKSYDSLAQVKREDSINFHKKDTASVKTDINKKNVDKQSKPAGILAALPWILIAAAYLAGCFTVWRIMTRKKPEPTDIAEVKKHLNNPL